MNAPVFWLGAIPGALLVYSRTEELGPALIAGLVAGAILAWITDIAWRVITAIAMVVVSLALLPVRQEIARTALDVGTTIIEEANRSQQPQSTQRSERTETRFLGYPLRAVNDCHLDVELVVRYQIHTGTWLTMGPYEIDGGSQTVPQYQGGAMVHTINPTVLLYARSQDNTASWTGEYSIGRYSMMAVNAERSEGHYVVTLACDTPAPPERQLVTRQGWLGVRILDVTERAANRLRLSGSPRGALVSIVNESGPSDGIVRHDDVILEFDGRPVPDSEGLSDMVRASRAGETVRLRVWRDRGIATLTVTLGDLGRAEAAGLLRHEDIETLDTIGLTVALMTQARRRQFSIQGDVRGVVVVDVIPGAPAADDGIVVGETIVEVSQITVMTPAEVTNRVDDARRAGRRSVLLLVSSPGGDPRFVAVSIE